MGTALTVTCSAAPDVPLDPVALLLADKRSPATRRAYFLDLWDFFGDEPKPDTVRSFLLCPTPEVALRLATFKAQMLARGLAQATINRRLAAVRSLLKMAHRVGLSATDGRSLVDGEKVHRYRDTRGVGLEDCRRLVHTPDTDTLLGIRDRALLRVMLELALRRAEVCALDVRDFQYAEHRLMVTGKGRGREKQPMTMSQKCADAVAEYLQTASHGEEADAPLFRSLDRRPGHGGDRLTADGLFAIIRRSGKAIGVVGLTPHKLRHSAITAALDATGGDVRRVQKLSRHADLRTVAIYDDNRADLQGEVTGLLAELL